MTGRAWSTGYGPWGGTVTTDAPDGPAKLRVSFPQAPAMAQTALSRSGPNAALAT